MLVPAPLQEVMPLKARVKHGLWIAVFVGGAALLSVEFVGQRMLAVVWGDSLAVWGATISVVLGGLAAGYSLGGRLADRRPHPSTLLLTLTTAAVFLIALSALGDNVLQWLGERVPGVRSGSLIGALLTLGPVSLLMAMTTPIVTKLRLTSLGRAGAKIGDVYALGTAGSIVGALATTFVGVAYLSLPGLLALSAAALLVCCAPLIASLRRGRALWAAGLAAGVPVCASLVALGSAPAVAAQGDRIVRFAEDSAYHRVLVTDDPSGVRYLQFNQTEQSAQRLDDPDELIFDYTQSIQRAFCETSTVDRVALIGVGAGTMVRSTRTLAPTAQIDAVDIDPVVLKAAQRFFSPPMGPGIRYVAEDGRRFLDGSAGNYDLVFLDAYSGLRIPPQMTTREFFTLVRARMTPEGVLAANIIAAPDSRLAGALVATAQEVWPDVRLYSGQRAAQRSGGDGNLILIASNNQRPPADACLDEVDRRLGMPVGTLRAYEPVPAPAGPVLTDDFAPANQLR